MGCGLEVVGSQIQLLENYTPSTLLGKGKVDEILQLIENTDAKYVIVDHHLTGIQTRNLEKKWKVKVLDRSQLILDIFAQRAQTFEGKIQVQLAQLMDQLPRMVDAWMGSLSRQGAGIGARGPGETALELDRRTIRKKIANTQKKLKDVQKRRKQIRSQRQKNNIPKFALIGYTNTGKSTLLNALTQSKVLVKDQLFATLDPTTKKVYLENIERAVLTDTVGFIRKLPTHLIEAFKATLEESADADVLIHVIDLASDQMKQQIEAVDELVKEFGWDNKPCIYVFNKIDIAPFVKRFQVDKYPRAFISAKNNEGLEKLKKLMINALESNMKKVDLFIPILEHYKIFELSKDVQVISKEESSKGIALKVKITETALSKWKDYIAS